MSTDERSYEEIAQDLADNNKFRFSYGNLLDKYNNLSNNSFSDLIWLFKYYDELFEAGPTENLHPNIKDAINSITGNLLYEKDIKEHKIFKNLLLNVKQIMFLDESGDFKEMTYSDLQNLLQKENYFTIGKISVGGGSSVLLNSLKAFGFTIQNNTRGIASERHDVGFKYFILSSEPIDLLEYVNLLEQSRTNESWYKNTFDDIDLLPQFNQETNTTFTYMQSNYIYQPRDGRMSLKGVNKELSSTETSTNTSNISVSDTGY